MILRQYTFYLCCITIIFTSQVTAQTEYCNSGLFLTNQFSSIMIPDVPYGAAENWLGVNQSLEMNIFTPDDGSTESRPLIVFVHGGAFISGDRSDMNELCMDFASKGYVTATIEYRLGFLINIFDICQSNESSFRLAMHRAFQDTRAALRFLTANAETYRVDTSSIFLGGASAGAISALHAGYLQDNEVEQFILDELGGLDESTNTLTDTYEIDAIISIAGALNEIDYITSGEQIPMILLHGTCDEIVPYGEGHYFECENIPTVYGTDVIANQAEILGIPSWTETYCGGDHGFTAVDIIEAAMEVTGFLYQHLLCEEPLTRVHNGNLVDTDCINANICLTTAIQEPDWLDEIQIAPNPNKGTFALNHLPNEIQRIEVVNIEGRVVETLIPGLDQMIYLDHLPSGIYFLKIHDDSVSGVIKFIIQ